MGEAMAMINKEGTWQSKKYIDWIKSLPSAVSQQPADDPHHVIIKGIDFGYGRNIKAPDWAAIPLTRQEHDEFHRDPEKWELLNGRQEVLLIKTLRRAFDDGVLHIDDLKRG